MAQGLPQGELILLIHGSFSRTSEWWRSGSSFCETLNTEVGAQGGSAQCWPTPAGDLQPTKIDMKLSPSMAIFPEHLASESGFGLPPYFAWDGENSEVSRGNAAAQLSEFIKRALLSDHITRLHLVGHSHGGNIICEALARFYQENDNEFLDSKKIGAVVTLGTPFFTKEHAKKSPMDRCISLSLIFFFLQLLFARISISGYFLFDQLLVLLASCFLVTIVFLQLFVLFGDNIYDIARKKHSVYKMPSIYAIYSIKDEALISLKSAIKLRAAHRLFAKSLAPTSWELFLSPGHPRLFRDGEWIAKGRWNKALSNLVKLVDSSLGRLLTYTRSKFSQIVVSRALVVMANRSLGQDNRAIKVTHVTSEPLYYMDGESYSITLPIDVEKKIFERLKESVNECFEDVYGTAIAFSKDPEISYFATEIYRDLRLLHNSYMAETAVIRAIAKIVTLDNPGDPLTDPACPEVWGN